jgi:two-component system LytT family response regulator
MKVVIIEDEVKAARELEKMLHQIDDTMDIEAVIDSVEQAIKWFGSNTHPDLIFSDIQLSDGLSFDIFRQTEIKSPVIFCTAYDEYLLNAFDTNAISYLLKPLESEKLEKAIEKFNSLKSVFTIGLSGSNILGLLRGLKQNYKSSLLVNHREKIIPVQIKEIAFFYLVNNVVQAFTLNGQKYFLSSSLDELEQSIDPSLFYRANRQFFINRSCILNVERFFARKLVVKLLVEAPETIIVSKAKATEFLQWLEG